MGLPFSYSAGGGYDAEGSRWGGFARGARIKLMRCIEFGGRDVDSSKLQAPATGSQPMSMPFDDGQLSNGLASPGVLSKVRRLLCGLLPSG